MGSRETNLTNQIRSRINTLIPGALILKHSDRVTRGIPDLQVIGQVDGESLVMFIEVKTDDGTVSAPQSAFIDKVNTCGRNVTGITARSPDDIDSFLRNWKR